MNPLIQLKKATPVFLVTLVCFGLLPTMQAVSPTPDGTITTFDHIHSASAITPTGVISPPPPPSPPPGIVNLPRQDLLFLAVTTLESQVKELKAHLQAQQVALQTLQTQFANHYHVITTTTTTVGHMPASLVTFNCPGMGQPCTARFGGLTPDNNVLIEIYDPRAKAPPPQTSTSSYNTSGPKP